MDFNIFDIFQYIILVFYFQILSSLVTGNTFKFAPGSFDVTLIVFDSFLLSGMTKYSRLTLYGPGINRSLLK